MVALSFLCIIVLIFILSAQSGTDIRLTNESKQWSKDSDKLVYYDQKSHCYRSTKTDQRATRHIGRDINGEPYEYVLNDSLFNNSPGKLIEARYLNVNKINEPVKYTESDKKKFM